MNARLHGALRVARRGSVEVLLLAAGCCTSAIPRLLLWTAAGAGAALLWRAGELHLAALCPRLDALGLRPAGRDAPWQPLRAAEAALRVLDRDLGNFRDFFPEARGQLAGAAARALDAHRLRVRAETALVSAPPGPVRTLLASQHARALQELRHLEETLHELRARFIASTQPLPQAADPAPGLAALDARSQALAAELAALPEPPGAQPSPLPEPGAQPSPRLAAPPEVHLPSGAPARIVRGAEAAQPERARLPAADRAATDAVQASTRSEVA